MIAAVVRAALVDEALAEGLRGHLSTQRERLERLKQRARKRRQLAKEAMVEVDLKKIVAPDFTLSVRLGAPALVVVDEDAIPSDYWAPRAPRLNRQELLVAMKLGQPIAGVALTNPEPVLSVRVR